MFVLLLLGNSRFAEGCSLKMKFDIIGPQYLKYLKIGNISFT